MTAHCNARPVSKRFPLGRATMMIAVLPVGALVLSACTSAGSSSSAPSSAGAPSSASPSSAPSSAGTGNGARVGPAASGLVAALTDTTMQVQNQQTGQVAVTWTKATKFMHAVPTTVAAAVKVGSCVVAVGPSGTSASGTSTPATATPATSFTASTLVVSAAVNGECRTGFAGGGTGARPTNLPTGMASRAPGMRAGGGAVSIGKVTSVSAGTVVIAAESASAVTIKTDADTKITTNAATTAKSLAVGKCVTAQGKPDSSGTVAATSVDITDATDGQCANGFGGFRNGG